MNSGVTNEMTECPYCAGGFEEGIEMKLVEVDIETGNRRYVCPECGFERWE